MVSFLYNELLMSKQKDKQTFEALVAAVYRLRDVRDNEMLQHSCILTPLELNEIKTFHKTLDDMLNKLEHSGIEGRLYNNE